MVEGKKGFGSELDQLNATIKNCVSDDELKTFIEEKLSLKDYLSNKNAIGLSKKKISMKDDILSDISERIYDIRCRIVHTKAADGTHELLTPTSVEIKFLHYDISLIEMIATKALIVTSRV